MSSGILSPFAPRSAGPRPAAVRGVNGRLGARTTVRDRFTGHQQADGGNAPPRPAGEPTRRRPAILRCDGWLWSVRETQAVGLSGGE